MCSLNKLFHDLLVVRTNPTMASKEESTLLKNIDDNFLSCCVCSERYKNAKILPCLHTFCEQCLRKIVEKRGELTCPICRRSHELPVGGVAALSANLFVNQLVEEFDKQDEKKATLKKCEACDIWDIHQRCIDCSINFCEHCVKAHRYMPIARSHRLIAIDEYQRAKSNNPASVRPPAYCSKHHDNLVKFYCDTCEVTICLECTAIDHPRPEHKFRYLDDAAAEYKQLLTKMTQELQIKENEAGESKAAVQQMTESVDSRFQEEIMKVKVHMEKTIEETTHKIRENGDSLLQQLKTEHEERKTNLQAQLKDLECTENDIAATRDYADKLMQYGNASQLMSAKNSMTSQIRELLKATTKCEPVDNDYVKFQSTDNFCETKTLGTIKITEERYELCGVSEYFRVDEQITLTLQVTGSRSGGTKVTRERITALMKTPDDKSEHVTVTDNYDRTFSLTYCAKAEGKHELSMLVDGQAVQGSPVTVVVVPKKGTVRTFGVNGSGIGQLSSPWGVTMTKSGHVIVDEESNNRLQSFTLQGKHQAIYKFTEIANFTPHYSAVSEDGKIFTTDFRNKQVVVSDENGQLIKCFGKDQQEGVFGIAISPYNGNVYVVDYSACCIRIYSQSGDYIKCFGSQGNGAGQLVSFPWCISVESSKGKVYVSDYVSHSVKVFDADGGFLFSFGSYGSADGQFNNPWGICNDLHGNVYVCDYINNRVQKFSSSGTFICQVDCGTEALRGPTGVCVTGEDPFQTIIVAELHGNRIRVVAL